MPRSRDLLRLAPLLLLSITACKRDRSSEDPVTYNSTFSERDGNSGSSPSPRQVCEHLAQMIAAEMGGVDPAVEAATVDECMIDMSQEQQLRGPEQWDLVARCVLDSRSAADIDRCDQLHPGPGGPSGAGTREEEACIYMISMVLYETGSAEAVSDAELEQMMGECLAAFDEDRRAMNSSSYDAMIDCFLNAQTAAQMEQCGG